MNDLNKVILIGRLTREPLIRHTQNGTSVANFSIASNRTYDKKDFVSFFNCIAWGKLGEVIVQYCTKGQRIGLEGKLQQRTWEAQDGTKKSTVEIVVDTVQFLDNKKSDSKSEGIESIGVEAPNEKPFDDQDLPF